MRGIDNRADTFTGQGSQRVGMWDDLGGSAQARRIFKMTDEIVGFSLSRLCSEGPIKRLTRTSNAQPAVVAYSLAVLAATCEIHPEILEVRPKYVLGHSVGEYSALAAAGVIETSEAIDLVRKRGLLMERFGGKGKMVAFLGFRDRGQVIEICDETGVEVANFNGPSQIVISGRPKEVDDAVRVAEDRGIRTVPLGVSCASHSSLMKPVREELRKVIAPIEFKDPIVPIVLNVTGRPTVSGAEIKAALVEQITAPVLWEQSIRWVIAQGVSTFWEFGPGSVLTGLLKRIDPEARGVWVNNGYAGSI